MDIEAPTVGLKRAFQAMPEPSGYHRYHLETKPAPDIVPYPSRFRVRVKKHRLAWLILKELLHYRANLPVVLSRPCVYGVFSGPVGGFAPRESLCVGCLRCTTQYPDVVQIYPNPERRRLGDSYFTFEFIDTVLYEARTGRIPVKGAGYRGRFGGEGWDGMWTDMSEIVRPTRDGIHGREFISTAVDIGFKPAFLTFDEQGQLVGPAPQGFSLPIPFLFDLPPASVCSQALCTILSEAARETQTLVILPLSAILDFSLSGAHLVPLVRRDEREQLRALPFTPLVVELAEWDETLCQEVRRLFPQVILALRWAFPPQGEGQEVVGREGSLLTPWSSALEAGVSIFHLVADYHGRGQDGRFVQELIREVHRAFVEANHRDQITLLGSGGIIAAEHVPKAIICGLDAVALDTPLLVALQARFVGECRSRETSRFQLPEPLPIEWGVQRLKNLLASWRDQMLEVLGAMGLREVRRLRGEIGRAMFQKELEREAFMGIEGWQ